MFFFYFIGNETGNNLETGGPGFACSTTCVDNLKLHDNIGMFLSILFLIELFASYFNYSIYFY